MPPKWFQWIEYLQPWRKKPRVESFQPFNFQPFRHVPDEVIINILSRLPAECVLKCRRVCKQWLVLTSSPYFAEMHLERALPVLLVRNKPMPTSNLEIFTINEWGTKDNKFKKIKKAITKDFSELMCSCNGLLVFRLLSNNSKYVIFNPVTLERVTIESPALTAYKASSIFAIFFHRPTKDYRLLLWCQTSFDPGSAYKFFIYSCRTKVWRKLGTFNHVPAYLGRTVILNNVLYWKTEYGRENYLSDSIITFDTESEEFRAIPHPGAKRTLWNLHVRTILMEAKGWLCVVTICDVSIDVWKLEDYKKSSWMNVACLVPRKGDRFFFPNFDPTYFNSVIKLPDLGKEAEFADWLVSGLCRHHFCDCTFDELQKARKKRIVTGFDRGYHTVSYTKSFVSVRSLDL